VAVVAGAGEQKTDQQSGVVAPPAQGSASSSSPASRVLAPPVPAAGAPAAAPPPPAAVGGSPDVAPGAPPAVAPKQLQLRKAGQGIRGFMVPMDTARRQEAVARPAESFKPKADLQQAQAQLSQHIEDARRAAQRSGILFLPWFFCDVCDVAAKDYVSAYQLSHRDLRAMDPELLQAKFITHVSSCAGRGYCCFAGCQSEHGQPPRPQEEEKGGDES
jgi:hypothetical protein